MQREAELKSSLVPSELQSLNESLKVNGDLGVNTPSC